MIGLSHHKIGEVDAPGVSRQSIRMRLKVVGLEVHLRLEDDEFLLQALFVKAEEVISLKVFLQSVVVQIVVRLAWGSSIADMAPLMLLTTMSVQLIVAVEVLLAETASRVPLKSALVNGARLVVAALLMLA
jgi:hypothetical protein